VCANYYSTGMNVATGRVMKLSRNGQVSLPAETRHRWNARRLLVVDLGDHVVVRPLPDDPIGELYGKYAGPGPTATEARRRSRTEDAAAERRRTKQ
jgi:bifunctional DNA-binding transcriptional regulator/antitoxin component of YhaV-PrlF toxin-antitoxin module